MVTHLFWAAVGVAGAWASARTVRRLHATGPRREPEGRLGRWLLPRLPLSPDQWATIARSRDVARHWARFAASIAAGAFCVLLVGGALLGIFTGGA